MLALFELRDIVVTTLAAGFIFMGAFRMPGDEQKTFAERLLFSIAIAAPAIILHEFGHKFVAIALGYKAVFHAAYGWLALGIVLKLLSFPFLFIVPAYVTIIGPTGFPAAAVAFAGPAVNGLLWLGAWLALRSKKKWSRKTETVLYFTRSINGFLFIFNIIPIPGFDGAGILTNIVSALSA